MAQSPGKYGRTRVSRARQSVTAASPPGRGVPLMNRPAPETVDQVVIRFAGDSGDGMQLLGGQFTRTSAIAGNDVATLPDFPAEIRAPAGTREGVSGFQLQFASRDIFTPGDETDVLVAMNPAALITNLQTLKTGGLIVVNTDKFKKGDLAKARLETNPLEDGTISEFRVVEAPIGSLTRGAVKPHGLNTKEADRCKNFFALGMMYWLYNREMTLTEDWVKGKFKGHYADANIAALHAGNAYAETVELFQNGYNVPRANLPEGQYRNITGNAALAIGLATAANKADTTLFYGSYPITPATDILHSLAPFKNYGVVTFQAEDEIAACCSAIGASWGGAIGVTGTSGPGLALKGEAMGLAMIVELPLIVINVQRGGPSTGLPTKTEQSDLLMAQYGRNGESPICILAPSTPADCFAIAMEAVKLTTKYMCPVMILSDGSIANGAEPWAVPNIDDIPAHPPKKRTDPVGYLPYMRDPHTLARPWAIPGTPGLEHRVGGLEKQHLTGNVSYDSQNHQAMCEVRAEKIQCIKADIPDLEVLGDNEGVLVLAWGSTYGACRAATEVCQAEGIKVGHAHLRHLNPFPANLGDVLSRYDKVLIPEMNLGQLVKLIRAEFLVDAKSLSKLHGQPFLTSEIAAAITAIAGNDQ